MDILMHQPPINQEKLFISLLIFIKSIYYQKKAEVIVDMILK